MIHMNAMEKPCIRVETEPTPRLTRHGVYRNELDGRMWQRAFK